MAKTTVSREFEQIPQVKRSKHRSTTPEGRNEARALFEKRRVRGLFSRAFRDAARAARASRKSPQGNFSHYVNMLNILKMGKERGVLVGGHDRAKRIEQVVLRERALEKELGLGKQQLHESLSRPQVVPAEPAVQVAAPEDRPQHVAYETPEEATDFYGEVPTDPLTPVFDRAKALQTRSLFDA